MVVRVRRRTSQYHAQAAGHAQVNDERPVSDMKQQILATARE